VTIKLIFFFEPYNYTTNIGQRQSPINSEFIANKLAGATALNPGRNALAIPELD